MEFGEATPESKSKTPKDPNQKWIGAKFNKTDDYDAKVVSAAEALMTKNNWNMRKLISECILFCNQEYGEE